LISGFKITEVGKELGVIRGRVIQYFDLYDNNWASSLPKKNWLLLLIADEDQIPVLDNIAKACLKNKVLYICGMGRAAAEIEEAFDEEISFGNIDFLNGGNIETDYDTPATTMHRDFDEGFWFASVAAKHEQLPIEDIFCLNLSQQNYKKRIINLIEKINAGWLPSHG
jgi:hypothetical protein